MKDEKRMEEQICTGTARMILCRMQNGKEPELQRLADDGEHIGVFHGGFKGPVSVALEATRNSERFVEQECAASPPTPKQAASTPHPPAASSK